MHQSEMYTSKARTVILSYGYITWTSCLVSRVGGGGPKQLNTGSWIEVKYLDVNCSGDAGPLRALALTPPMCM